MGIKHGIGNGNGREWETTSTGMGITCTPIGIYVHRFFFTFLLCMVYNTKGTMSLNLKYEAEPDRECF